MNAYSYYHRFSIDNTFNLLISLFLNIFETLLTITNVFKSFINAFIGVFSIQLNKLFSNFINIEKILIVLIDIILFNIKLIFRNIKKF